MRLIVNHRRYFLLIEDSNFLLMHPKVVVSLKKFHSLGVSVLRCHYDHWNGLTFAELGLKGMQILAVILQKAFFC